MASSISISKSEWGMGTKNGWTHATRIPHNHNALMIVLFSIASVLVVLFLYSYGGSALKRKTLSISEKQPAKENSTSHIADDDRPLFGLTTHKIIGIPVPFLTIHPSILGGVYIACRALQLALFFPALALSAQVFSAQSTVYVENEDEGISGRIVLVMLVVTSISSVYTLLTARFLSYFRSTSTTTAANLSPSGIIQLLFIGLFDSIFATALSMSTYTFTRTITSQNCNALTYSSGAALTSILNNQAFNNVATISSGEWQVDFTNWMKTVESSCSNVKMLGVIVTVESLLLSMSSLAAMGQGVQSYWEFVEAEKREEEERDNSSSIPDRKEICV